MHNIGNGFFLENKYAMEVINSATIVLFIKTVRENAGEYMVNMVGIEEKLCNQ
jgi:hypothetical protein